MIRLLPLVALLACGDGEVTLRRNDQINPDLVVEQVTIQPVDPTTAHDLFATATASAPDGTAVRWTYAWFIDDQPVQEGQSDTLPAAATTRGQVVVVEATPSDGERDGLPARSEPVTVVNGVPTLQAATVTPERATRRDALTCAAVDLNDVDDDPITLRYTWSIGEREVPLDSATLPAGTARRDDQVRCAITASDPTSTAETVWSEPVVIGNAPPELSEVQLSPRPAYTTSVLTASAIASDPDGDAVNLQWSWQINGVDAGGSSALPSDRFVRGDTIAAQVVGSDGIDASEPAATTELTIRNSPPSQPTVALLSDDARALRPITCELVGPSTDADDDRITYTFDFFRNGEPYTGDLTTTLIANDTVPGDQVLEDDVWTCAAQAWDRIDTSPWSDESPELSIGPPVTEFYIRLADLVNQGTACGGSGVRYNDCRSGYGFTWTDRASVPPRTLEITYTHAINCGGTADRTARINDEVVGTGQVGDARFCSCSLTSGPWTRTRTYDVPDSYLPDEENTFTLDATSCEGFAPDGELSSSGDDVYARVVLRY